MQRKKVEANISTAAAAALAAAAVKAKVNLCILQTFRLLVWNKMVHCVLIVLVLKVVSSDCTDTAVYANCKFPAKSSLL